MTKSKKAQLRKKPSTHIRSALAKYPEFVQELLAARNIVTADDANAFFNPDYDAHVGDPFLMRDMRVAVERIARAIDENEHIAVYSDFDADGIPGGALLHDVFSKVGHERFTNYIPHRDTEGYGFHTAAVERLAREGVTLIITVDVGIADIATVAYANELGVDVIVTDHHLPGDELPAAVAVVNPHRTDETYPFHDLCGTGVAYKVAQALLQYARAEKKTWVDDIPEGWEKWLLDLVAIATVADMMPLVGENRALVHYGLVVLRKSQRPGVGALCRKLRISQAYLTEDDIGFSIAPRLNAASRMDNPEKGFELLTTRNLGVAADIATQLEALNNKRKGNVASIVRELKKRFAENSDGEVLVAGNPKWNPALLGLAANSIVDTFGKTVCLWGREGTGSIKGSCRGAGDVNVVDMFASASDTFTQYGGHAHAGGFSLEHEHVHTLSSALNDAYKKVAHGETKDDVEPDADLSHASLREVHTTLMRFAPFGIANPKPVLVCRDARVAEVRQFGKEDAHMELQLVHNGSQQTIRAIAFFKNPQSFSTPPVVEKNATVLCTLELSRFAGRVQLELRIVDIV